MIVNRKMGNRQEADVDKIRRGAVLAMKSAAEDEPHLAYLCCAWIKRHCEELLYEDVYDLPMVKDV